jgi:hypothetical protein
VAVTAFHDPVSRQSLAAGLSVASTAFSSDGAGSKGVDGRPQVDVVTGVAHFSSPRYLADLSASVHAQSGRLHSYALRGVTRSHDSAAVFPHLKVGLRLAEKGELSVGEEREGESALVDCSWGRPPCVLSSTAVFCQTPTVQWKAYLATDGLVSASLHRQLLPGLQVEAAVTTRGGNGGAERREGGARRTAVGVAVTLG